MTKRKEYLNALKSNYLKELKDEYIKEINQKVINEDYIPLYKIAKYSKNTRYPQSVSLITYYGSKEYHEKVKNGQLNEKQLKKLHQKGKVEVLHEIILGYDKYEKPFFDFGEIDNFYDILKKDKIKEIYEERNLSVSEEYINNLLRSFPNKSDPVIERYVKREYIKTLFKKHKDKEISNEKAQELLNKYYKQNFNLDDYWNNLEFAQDMTVIPEENGVHRILHRHWETSPERIQKWLKEKSRKTEVYENKRESLEELISLFLIFSSIIGLNVSIKEIQKENINTLTGLIVSEYFAGISISLIFWSAVFLIGIVSLFFVMKKNKNQKK